MAKKVKAVKEVVVEEVKVENTLVEAADVVEYVADETTLDTDKEVVDEAIAEEPKKVKKAKKNKEKEVAPTITVMDNDTLKKLFQENGCQTYTAASNTSNVVYNTFGTKSRVLQQKKAYQLLLTNGHKDVKGSIVECENDDTKRFMEWYETLTDEQKGWVVGYSEITATKLSQSEMPRERTVKITSYDLLVKFIQFMGTFAENQILAKAE